MWCGLEQKVGTYQKDVPLLTGVDMKLYLTPTTKWRCFTSVLLSVVAYLQVQMLQITKCIIT